MAASRKKVIVRRFSAGCLPGYLPGSGLLADGTPGALGLLDLSAKVVHLPLDDVKYVAYVRDFNPSDPEPERLSRKTFAGRPRNEGLWLRLFLRDGDLLEGLAALDLAFADGWTADGGVAMVPPDIRGNTQRLFVPRTSIERMEIIAAVTTPSRKAAAMPAPADDLQTDLFHSPAAAEPASR